MNKVYNSDLKEIFGKSPERIYNELEKKASKLPVQEVKDGELAKIKVPITYEPNLIAKEVTKEIDSFDEFRTMDHLKDFINEKKQANNKKHLEILKK